MEPTPMRSTLMSDRPVIRSDEPSPGVDVAMLRALIAALLAGAKDLSADEWARMIDERKRQESRQDLTDAGRLTDTQRAYVLSRSTPEGQQSALATVTMLGRHRLLRAAGIDPRESWVSKMIGPQLPQETDEQYVERARRAKAAYEQQRAAAAAKNRERTAAERAKWEAAGRPPGTSFAVTVNRDPRSYAERERQAEQYRRGSNLGSDAWDAQESAWALRNPGPLPERAPTYQAHWRVGDNPTVHGAMYGRPETAAEGGRNAMEEFKRLLIGVMAGR